MQRGARHGEQLATTREIDAVVGVTPISRAPSHRYEPLRAQTRQMVGDKVLRPPDQVDELANLTVAPSELAQQLPAQRVPNRSQEVRRRRIAAHGWCAHDPATIAITI